MKESTRQKIADGTQTEGTEMRLQSYQIEETLFVHGIFSCMVIGGDGEAEWYVTAGAEEVDEIDRAIKILIEEYPEQKFSVDPKLDAAIAGNL